MINSKDYYKAPPKKVFEEIKEAAIKLWKTYDNTYGYVDEKVNRIKDLENISDNYAYIVAMFDGDNQIRLLTLLKTKEAGLLVRKLIDPEKEY